MCVCVCVCVWCVCVCVYFRQVMRLVSTVCCPGSTCVADLGVKNTHAYWLGCIQFTHCHVYVCLSHPLLPVYPGPCYASRDWSQFVCVPFFLLFLLLFLLCCCSLWVFDLYLFCFVPNQTMSPEWPWASHFLCIACLVTVEWDSCILCGDYIMVC